MTRAKEEGSVAELLADWFWGHRATAIVPDEAVKAKVQEEEGRAGPPYTASRKHRLISEARASLRMKHPGYTIIRVRGFGYKLSTPLEYAGFAIGHLRRATAYAHLFLEYAPHADRTCLSAELCRQISGSRKELLKLARIRQELSTNIKEWRKEIAHERAES